MKYTSRTLNLTELSKIFQVRGTWIKTWINREYLTATMTPKGWAIGIDAVTKFLLGKRTPHTPPGDVPLTHLTADRILNGELVTIPHAAAKFEIPADQLYRANAKQEIVFFDLPLITSRGLRVLMSDVQDWMADSKETEKAEQQTIDLGKVSEQTETIQLGVDPSLDDLLAFAEKRLTEARAFSEAVKSAVYYTGQKKELDGKLAGAKTDIARWLEKIAREKIVDGDDVIVESREDLFTFLGGVKA